MSYSFAIYLLPPATTLGQGYIFTGICDSVHGGGGRALPRGGWACMVEGMHGRYGGVCGGGHA